jgi:hypothetical protein
MKAADPLLLASILAGVPCAAGPPSETATRTTAASQAATDTRITSNELWLSGLVRVDSAVLAFIRIEEPGKPALILMLGEGENASGVNVVKIDMRRETVTVRYRTQLRDLALRDRGGGQRQSSIVEKEKDLSHSKYHTLRAKLDREQDERDARQRQESAGSKIR